MNTCPLCAARTTREFGFFGPSEPQSTIKCEVCGEFIMSERLATQLGLRKPSNYHLYAGAIRELNERDLTPWVESFPELLRRVTLPETPVEKMDRLLLSIGNSRGTADQAFTLSENDFPRAYAQNYAEYCYFARTLAEMGYLSGGQSGGTDFRVSGPGWKRISELNKERRELATTSDEGNYRFTSDEVRQIETHLDELRDALIVMVRKSDESEERKQAFEATIKQDLADLKADANKLGRKDWKNHFIGAVMNLILLFTFSAEARSTVAEKARFLSYIVNQVEISSIDVPPPGELPPAVPKP